MFDKSAPSQGIIAFLVSFHILVIALSNYLVQIPISIVGFHSTLGTLSFPFVFLATDLTVRLLGAATARTVIFWVMIPALIISYIFSVLFFEGQLQAIEGLLSFNVFVFRIALASFVAYIVGQLCDVFIFSRLRHHSTWWLAPSGSTLFGSLIDTFIFFFIAFYASSNEFLAQHWVEIAWVDYCFKLVFSLVLLLPAYGILVTKWLKPRR